MIVSAGSWRTPASICLTIGGNGDKAEEEDRCEQCEVSREDRDHPPDAPACEEVNERPEPERDDTPE